MRELAFSEIRWGESPSEVIDVKVARPGAPARPVCALRACSYITTKAGKPEVYRHAFKKVNNRYPYLLELDSDGDYRTPDTGSEVICLGQLIDVETVDGEVILTPLTYVATTEECLEPQGGPVLFVSPFDPSFALEHREGTPYIRAHGIIG